MTTNKLIDSHAHLNFEGFDEDREEIIEKCEERISGVIDTGSKFETNEKSLKISEKHEGFIFSCIGSHPIHEENEGRVLNQIKENSDKIVGIGEIGLDYHHHKEKERRKNQEGKFENLLELSKELGKTPVIHTRDAEKRVMEILGKYEFDKLLLHCFNGTLELAKEAVDRGYYISISTQVLYSNRVKLLARALPVENLILETDSPFLGGGDRNFPWNIEKSLKVISKMRGEDKEDLEEKFFQNTLEVFPDLSSSF